MNATKCPHLPFMTWHPSPDGLALALRLSQLRSAIRVGSALAKTCPTEEAWAAVMADPEMQETLAAVAEITRDVEQDLEHATSDTAMDVVANHHSRGLEALDPLAQFFGIDPEDLLVVLTT